MYTLTYLLYTYLAKFVIFLYFLIKLQKRIEKQNLEQVVLFCEKNVFDYSINNSYLFLMRTSSIKIIILCIYFQQHISIYTMVTL